MKVSEEQIILLILVVFFWFSFFYDQGVLMIQDQYRAIMQYSVSKESSNHEKVLTDWYCAKVSQFILFNLFFPINQPKDLLKLNIIYRFHSVVFSISNGATTASNVMHRVRRVKKVERAAMKSATY